MMSRSNPFRNYRNQSRSYRPSPSDMNMVIRVFRKYSMQNDGEMSADQVPEFFEEIFGPAPTAKRGWGLVNTKRLLEINKFSQEASSTHNSDVSTCVITVTSFSSYLRKNGGKELRHFAQNFKMRQGKAQSTAIQPSGPSKKRFPGMTRKEEPPKIQVNPPEIKPQSRPPQTKQKIAKVPNVGFACKTCDREFLSWSQCLAHLRQASHMGAPTVLKGLQKKTKKHYRARLRRQEAPPTIVSTFGDESAI